MTESELNDKIEFLIQSPGNTQEFMDIASNEENWSKIDKNIKLPRNVGFTELECPSCFDPLRLIYEKFATQNYELELVCPHCTEKIKCIGEYTGYTNDISLEEV
ncbi:hypothetical protein ACFLRY_00410 [Bacteroidota bacterium]